MKLHHLSASRIKTFEQCPLKYHAIYDLEIPDGPPHPLTVMGSAVHKVFEDGVGAIMEGKSYSFTEQVAPVCAEMGVTAQNTKLARELVDNCLAWGYLRNVSNCVGVEVRFDLELPDGTKVVGFIDRLDVKDGKADVIDLKTQKRAFDDAHLSSEWQSVVYNWVTRQIRPDVHGDLSMSYWVLRHHVQRCWMSEGDAKDGECRLMKVADEIRSCDDPQPKTSALCQFCPYQSQCTASTEGVKSRFKRRYK
jgi:RecB family exonuclease